MAGNTFGKMLQLTTWGESHGTSIGGVIDGVPPCIPISEKQIAKWMLRRQPGQSPLTSPRQEKDFVKILSGIFEGKTTGTPLAFMIENTDAQSKDYETVKDLWRPGHADYTYDKKYGIRDYRGGGRASARETAVRVAAGAIASQVLGHIMPGFQSVRAAIVQIGPYHVNPQNWSWEHWAHSSLSCPDSSMEEIWTSYLAGLKNEGRSTGAVIEVHIEGIPAGLGEPVFDRLDADLAKAFMGINAVKGVEIGTGFGSVEDMKGYDETETESGHVHFLSNKAGGILGGISTGQDIYCKVAFKGTSSTREPRKMTGKNGQNAEIAVFGRHDPCVAVRAPVIVEAMATLTLADHFLRWRAQCGSDWIRESIAEVG